jgi:hypothetical protein
MKNIKFPSVVVSAILVGIVALLNYLLNHVGNFGIPDLYAPLVALAISTVIKMVQEQMPDEPAAVRGFIGDEPSYWARVLYK